MLTPRRSLTLRPGRERSVLGRHPWVFEGAVARDEGPASAAIGDLFDANGEYLASGFYSAKSQIRLRLVAFGDDVLDEAFLRARIAEAVRRRDPLAAETDAVRLIHSEGDDLSGIVADRYGDTIVLEITSAGADRARQIVLDGLREATGVERFAIKNDLPARQLEKLSTEDQVVGGPSEERIVTENGVRFHVTPGAGQKTGFFLDQRENRALIGRLAAGREVLNLFAYSGGFGVHAAAGGATLVEEVDSSGPALELARRNHALNGTQAVARFTEQNAFGHVRGLARDGVLFDIVVCDPPAFAKSRNEIERAARGYKDINLYAMKLVRPGGVLATFSCSGHMSADLFQKVIFSAAADNGRRCRILRRLGAGPDHPVSIYAPEGEYLKGFLLEVD